MCDECWEKSCMQGFGGQNWGKETTLKTYIYVGITLNNHQETKCDAWTELIWNRMGTSGWLLWTHSLTDSLHQIQELSSLVETIWDPGKLRCSMETDTMLCRLVCISASVLFLDIRYFSTPFFYRCPFSCSLTSVFTSPLHSALNSTGCLQHLLHLAS